MKIIAFPFAGGSKYSFNNYFPIDYNVSILEYPGRGLRIKENLAENINGLISDLFAQFKKEIDSCDDYVIYGHSMGALVGYLICQEIDANFKKPAKLIVSGAKPPKYSREKIVSNLPDEDFWSEVYKLGGVTEDVKNHPELIEYFTPILKADFKCIENYHHDENSTKLTIPIDVFYGSHEDVTQLEAEAWQEETTSDVNVTKLEGDHFFILNHKDYFKEYFKNLQLHATI